MLIKVTPGLPMVLCSEKLGAATGKRYFELMSVEVARHIIVSFLSCGED